MAEVKRAETVEETPSLPGIYSNLFQVMFQGDGILRIIFRDQTGSGAPVERGHITMTRHNARELGQMLINMTQDTPPRSSAN